MSDNVVVLPIVRIEPVDPKAPMHPVRVQLTGRALKRLEARAKEWGIPIEEAASGLLDQALTPHGRKR